MPDEEMASSDWRQYFKRHRKKAEIRLQFEQGFPRAIIIQSRWRGRWYAELFLCGPRDYSRNEFEGLIRGLRTSGRPYRTEVA